jgi:hypothetical protein
MPCGQTTHDGEVVTASPFEALADPGAIDALMIGATAEEWNFMLGNSSLPLSHGSEPMGEVKSRKRLFGVSG